MDLPREVSEEWRAGVLEQKTERQLNGPEVGCLGRKRHQVLGVSRFRGSLPVACEGSVHEGWRVCRCVTIGVVNSSDEKGHGGYEPIIMDGDLR
ncbi:MAG: hypothetical protein RIS76_346 [Verrucomicrobiota bacterium]